MTSHTDGLDYPLFFCPLELWPGVDRDVDFCFGDAEIPDGAWTFVVRHATGDALALVGVVGTAGDDEPVPGPKITFTVPGDRVADIMRQEYVVFLDGAPEGGGPIRPADFQSSVGTQVATVTLGRPSVAEVTVVVSGSGGSGLIHDDVFPAYGQRIGSWEGFPHTTTSDPEAEGYTEGVTISNDWWTPGQGMAFCIPHLGTLGFPVLFSDHRNNAFLSGSLLSWPDSHEDAPIVTVPEWARPASDVDLTVCIALGVTWVTFDDNGMTAIHTEMIDGLVDTDGNVTVPGGIPAGPDNANGVLINFRFSTWQTTSNPPASASGVTVHNDLTGRDVAESHPASAIDVDGTPLNEVLLGAGAEPWTPVLRNLANGEAINLGAAAHPPTGSWTIVNGWLLGTAFIYFGEGMTDLTGEGAGLMLEGPADVLTVPDSHELVTCGSAAILFNDAINATSMANILLSGGDYKSWFGIEEPNEWPKNYIVFEHADGTPGRITNKVPIEVDGEGGGYLRIELAYPVDNWEGWVAGTVSGPQGAPGPQGDSGPAGPDPAQRQALLVATGDVTLTNDYGAIALTNGEQTVTLPSVSTLPLSEGREWTIWAAVFNDGISCPDGLILEDGSTVTSLGIASAAPDVVTVGIVNGAWHLKSGGRTSLASFVSGAIADLSLGSAASHAESDFIAASAKGSASGVAELDEDGLVPSAQLPGFVDDVREVADEAALSGVVAASGVIYIALAENTQWRWSGSTFVQLTAGGLVLGETSASAYRGDRGKEAYDHSQATGNPHGAAVADITGLSTALGNKLDASDASVTNSRTPSGSAGGDLTGTFPNPTIGSGKVTSTHILDGTIVDADINSAAAIAATKLATPATGLYVSGTLYSTQVALGGTRSVAPGTIYFWPLDFDGPVTLDGLSINVATGGSSSVAHLYVVTGSATTGRPSAASTILATCSNIATATSSTRVTAAFDGSATLAVTRGRLWAAVHAIVGTATFQAAAANVQLGPPYQTASTYSANALSGISAAGGGTSSTALTTLAGISMNATDVNQGPVVYWRAH
jgi:hypothetical protein